MSLNDILKNDFLKITIGVLFVLIFFISFININWKNPSFKENYISYILIFVTSVAISFCLYLYLTDATNIENKKVILDFLKTLLPTILAILSLLYALSSGLFNLKKENLQHDINKFEKQKDSLHIEVKVAKDSVESIKNELIEKNNTLVEYEKNIKFYRDSISEIKNESEAKSSAISELEKLNQEYDKQLKKRLSITKEPFVQLVGVAPNRNSGFQISVYNKNLKQLTNNEITILDYSPYNHQTNAKYDTKSKKFDISLGFIGNYEYQKTPNIDFVEVPYIISIFKRTKKLTSEEVSNYNKGSYLNFRNLDRETAWKIPVPYVGAEYKIILNDF